MKSLRIFLLASLFLVFFGMDNVEASSGVQIDVDVTSIERDPGFSANFSVLVKNTGDENDTIHFSIRDDDLDWGSVYPESVDLGVNETETVTVTVALPEYDLNNLSSSERNALEGNQYEIRIKAKCESDLSVSVTEDLTTEIGDVYGASLTVIGSDTVVTYPSTEDSANDRREKFTLKLINLGNRNDNINVDTITTTYPDEWTVSIFTSASCSGSFTGSIGAGESKYLYLCVTPDQDSDIGNYTILTEASANDGDEEAVQASVTVDVRDPTRDLALTPIDTVQEIYPEHDGTSEQNSVNFKVKLENTGSHKDTYIPELESNLDDGWSVTFWLDSGKNEVWSSSGVEIEAGGLDNLWVFVEVADEADAGNYTIQLSIRDEEDDPNAREDISLIVVVRDPIRDLVLTPIDTIREIYPEYGASSSQNSVKFKFKLENTGSHKDTYIPEVASTLDSGWSVSFWQDSSKTQSWPTSGVEIEAGELDDLWIFVEVDDEADEGNYTVQFSVYDEDENPDARKDGDVTVTIIRPEIVVKQSNIRIETDGVFGNATTVKEEDTVVIYVDIENMGTADADDVRVEVFYYPKKSPETQNEIDNLLIAGFEFDEGKDMYINLLYDKTTNIKSKDMKSIVSDDWLIEGGEWYVEVRADYDEDNDNGEILEPNENNNDARYSELLRVKPDLQIDTMRVDSKYSGSSAQTPNIDDIVTFTVTVSNKGASDVKGARLYITADSSEGNEILKDRTNRDYVEFDVDAGETTDVRLRWKAVEEEWTTFRAEVNPVCDDVDIDSWTCESEGDGFAIETNRMFDELGRYADNEYPLSGVFEQNGAEVRFEVLPDFIIKKIDFYPTNFQVGQSVEITVTIENIGNSDWYISMMPMGVIFKDGTGAVLISQVGESINKGDTTEVVMVWEVPRQGNLVLTFTIDAGSGNFEIQQCNNCDPANSGHGTDNDEYSETITVGSSGLVLPSEGKECTNNGEIQNADDGCNQCICNEGEWICTEVSCKIPEEEGIPSISLLTSLISIGLVTIFRRK